jgi:hypothetical protein
VSLRGLRAGGRRWVAIQHLANCSALVVVHHSEIEYNIGYAIKCTQCAVNAILNLGAQRAAGNGEHDSEPNNALLVDDNIANHAQVHDGTVQLWVLYGTECVDELVC